MSRVFVTGAAGFLGGHVARRLIEEGHEVLALARRPPAPTGRDALDAVRWISGDLTQASTWTPSLRGCEAVFHVAALVAFHPVAEAEAVAANVEGTRLLLEAAEAAGVRRFVHCSTVAALGLPPGRNDASDETAAYNWKERGLENLYSRTKRAADDLVESTVRQGRLDAVILYPGTMVGPQDPKPSSGRLLVEAARGRLVLVPAGRNTFCDVRSVAEGFTLAWRHGRTGEGYILSGPNLTYREFFGRVCRLAGVREPLGPLPRPVAMAGGFFGDMMSSITKRDFGVGLATVRVAWANHAYSSAKAERELGWKSTDLDRAILDGLADFKARGLI